MSVDLIVLDMDDTLYLERDYVRSGFEAVDRMLADEHGVFGAIDWLWDAFEEGVRGNTFDLFVQAFHLPGELRAQMVEVYRDHHPNIRLEQDAELFLKHWYGRVPLALVTDGYGPGQQRKIDALGIEHYFDELVLTGLRGEGWVKPNTTAFAYLQERFRVAADRCIYIGDNPTKDFAGPQRLGWRWQRVRRVGSLYFDVEDGLPYRLYSELEDAVLQEGMVLDG